MTFSFWRVAVALFAIFEVSERFVGQLSSIDELSGLAWVWVWRWSHQAFSKSRNVQGLRARSVAVVVRVVVVDVIRLRHVSLPQWSQIRTTCALSDSLGKMNIIKFLKLQNSDSNLFK
jgi:hypothetical protein